MLLISQEEVDMLAAYLPEEERSYTVDVESSGKDRYSRGCNCSPVECYKF